MLFFLVYFKCFCEVVLRNENFFNLEYSLQPFTQTITVISEITLPDCVVINGLIKVREKLYFFFLNRFHLFYFINANSAIFFCIDTLDN